MPLKIALSQIKSLPFDFESAVTDHIKALQDHRFTVQEAAPSPGHSWVEAAVRRVQYPVEDERPDDFVAAYEVIDDTPPPLTLDEKKTVLANTVTQQAVKIIDSISPPLKRRMRAIEVGNARAADESKRTQAQRRLIADADADNDRANEVELHLAKLESQIHDLSAATIDDWKPAPFPK